MPADDERPPSERPQSRPEEAAAGRGDAELFWLLAQQVEDHALFMITPDGRNATWNPGVRHVFGFDAREFLGQPTYEVFTPEDRAAGVPERELREARTKGKASDDRWLIRADGTRFWGSGVTYALRDAAGRFLGYGKIVRDQTAQKHAQDALAASETALRLALAAAHAGTWRYYHATRTQELGENFRRMLGLVGRGALPFDDFLTYVHPDDREHVIDAIEQALTQSGRMWTEFRIIRPDGTIRWLRSHGEVLRDTQGHPESLTGTAIDITEARVIEERLRQSQRMDAVGKLAGGVAHEVNNMMTVVLGFTGVLLEQFPPGDPRRADLEQVRVAASRAATVTAQLLAFSRRQLLQPTNLVLGDVIEALRPVLTRLLGPGRELVIRTMPGTSRVHADRGQLEQLLINLALNARDAMPNGGRLSLKASNVTLDAAFAARYPEESVATGPYVLLCVHDTGHGMDVETLAHIFEPFFTSKPIGQGTGLGLATVYGIVKQSGGYIWAESEPGHGATFRVYFPAVDATGGSASSVAPAPVDASEGGGKTVLVIDDEDMVRGLVVRMLTSLGYTCLEAKDGVEALHMLQANSGAAERIDLVVSDLVMPGMHGREFAGRLAQMRPDLPVLFISGYTDDELVRQELLVPGAPFLQKPFSVEGLAAKLRTLLSGE